MRSSLPLPLGSVVGHSLQMAAAVVRAPVEPVDVREAGPQRAQQEAAPSLEPVTSQFVRNADMELGSAANQ